MVMEMLTIISGYKEKLRRLDNRCYEIMQRGHRPGTRRNLRSQAGIYAKFCEEHGLVEFPASEWQLVRYAGYTASQVTSHGTVDNYVGGVRTLHRIAGFEVPEASSPNLKLMMKGIKAELSKPLKQSMPVTPQILTEISFLANLDNDFQLCNFSAMLTAFYMCLRKSNLVPVSTPQFSQKEQLTRGKVAIDEEKDIAMVLIEWSKVMQHNENQLWVALHPANNKRICPIDTLYRMYKQIPAGEDDPCFCYRNRKNVLKALTYDQLLKQMREWIKMTGRDPSRYSLHGLRRGGTSHCFNSGISTETIKTLGSWSSDKLFQIHRHQSRFKDSRSDAILGHSLNDSYFCRKTSAAPRRCEIPSQAETTSHTGYHPLRFQLFYVYPNR